jgi:Zn-dependent metalloprotease
MSRILALLVPVSLAAFFAALALAGCRMEPTPIDGAEPDPLARLEADTGHPWSVRWHPDVHTAAFLDGKTHPLAVTPEDARREGRNFMYRYSALFGLRSEDTLSSIAAETDELGMTHARFAHEKNRVPVWGGELVAHFAADGALTRVNGRVLPLDSIDVMPTVDAAGARVAAVLDAQAMLREENEGQLTFDADEPKLWLLPLSAGEARLAWRVEVEVMGAAEPNAWDAFVDAKDASILRRDDRIATLAGSGTGVFGDTRELSIVHKKTGYYLESEERDGLKTYSAGWERRLPGSAVRSSSPTSWDALGDGAGAAVDAHANLALTWDWYFRELGRRGWSGDGGVVRATVHFGSAFDNAFWNGRQLAFGDGNADVAPFAAALDVVAHEYTHGVVAWTAGLGNRGQPGALNEGIADLFGAFVSYGSGRGGDWQIGETVFHPSGHPAPLRDLSDPHRTRQPAHADEYDERRGTHFNSTIASHAGYLMAAGGPGVMRLGVPITSRIWYRALSRYLTREAGFADLADATLAAARDLRMGESSVRAAWVAVGVMR